MKQSLDDKKLTPAFYKYCNMLFIYTYGGVNYVEDFKHEWAGIEDFKDEWAGIWDSLSDYERERVDTLDRFVEDCRAA